MFSFLRKILSSQKLSEEKIKAREQVLAKRRSLSCDDYYDLSTKISHALFEEILSSKPKVVALYHAIHGEVDLKTLANKLTGIGVKVALPRVVREKQPLVFNLWKVGEELDVDAKNIPCARGDEVTPDIVVCPVVAFNEQGHRLGYGSAFYDRTFELLENTKRFGAAFSFQEDNSWQAEGKDVPMHKVVTEKKVWSFKSK